MTGFRPFLTGKSIDACPAYMPQHLFRTSEIQPPDLLMGRNRRKQGIGHPVKLFKIVIVESMRFKGADLEHVPFSERTECKQASRSQSRRHLPEKRGQVDKPLNGRVGRCQIEPVGQPLTTLNISGNE